jgi:serine protease Do
MLDPPSSRRILRAARPLFFSALGWAMTSAIALSPTRGADPIEVGSRRMTPIVRAVRDVSDAVVNIQGHKSVADEATGGATSRQVNGMGTGVVIDSRGYVLTNFHVVDGVRQIRVTLASGQTYIAQLVSHDRETDLAIIRIRTPQPLPVVKLGASSDLMTGETVVAVGNAFGYEHTVTTGIISALHRNVQVNETQQYLDLIQTDASINPGNSGGPLLNIDGEMIGVNVAVRAGAQGIGFAIPVDKALDVATRMLQVERLENHWHGIIPIAADGPLGPVTVARVDKGSPARQSGVRSGDELQRIGGVPIERALDVERAFLGRRTGERVTVVVRRGGQIVDLDLQVAVVPGTTVAQESSGDVPATARTAFDRTTWQTLGVLLQEESKQTFQRRGLPFQGGMRVTEVRAGSSAAQQGVVAGDLLVRVHRWYTTSEQDVQFIMSRVDSISNLGQVRFDIVRGDERYFGHLALKSVTETNSSRR